MADPSHLRTGLQHLRAQRAPRARGEGGAYRLEEINILEDAHKTPEYRARHPFAKVPAFEHDGFELYETAAIMRYVDETFEGPSLQPDEPRARARMT